MQRRAVISGSGRNNDGQEQADTAADGARLRIPLNRTEVAALVALLCSEDGGFISGQMVAVNGGGQT